MGGYTIINFNNIDFNSGDVTIKGVYNKIADTCNIKPVLFCGMKWFGVTIPAQFITLRWSKDDGRFDGRICSETNGFTVTIYENDLIDVNEI